MKQYTLNGYTIAFPDIPEGETEVYLCEWGTRVMSLFFLSNETEIQLPEGDWQLYSLFDLPEKMAMEMVDRYNNGAYRDYGLTKYFAPDNDTLDILLTAHASLVSWVRAQGVTEPDPWILIKKNV